MKIKRNKRNGFAEVTALVIIVGWAALVTLVSAGSKAPPQPTAPWPNLPTMP